MNAAVLIVGAYGPFNAGDELILHSIVRSLRSSGYRAVPLVADPQAAEAMHGTGCMALSLLDRKPADVHGMVGEVAAVVLGGGEMLQEARLGNPFRGLLRRSLKAARLSRRLGVPFLLWSVGIEDLKTTLGRAQARRVIQATSVTVVRDRSSLDRARSLAPSATIALSADAAFLLRDSTPPHRPLHPRRLLVAPAAVSASGQVDAERLVSAAMLVASRHGARLTILLMDSRPAYDGRLRGDILRNCPVGEFDLIDGTALKPTQLLELFAGAYAVAASRMHAVIAASIVRVPVLNVVRGSKMAALAANLPSTASIPSQSSPAELEQAVDNLFENAEARCDSVQQEVEDLVNKARAGEQRITEEIMR